VIRGDHRPAVADPGRCTALTDSYRARMTANPLTRWQLDPPGFSAWVHFHGVDAALCTRNYRDSVFEGTPAYQPANLMSRYLGAAECTGCPNLCIKRFSDGLPDSDPRASGIHQEITGALGPNIGVGDLDTVLQANVRCNELGLDPTSLGFSLSMAMEC